MNRNGPIVLLAALCSLAATSARADGPRWSEPFDSVTGWKALPSDGVGLKIAPEPGPRGGALRIDYDFARGSGYGIVRHEFASALQVPENYRFRFRIRGRGPSNTLEFKLVEKTTGADGQPGENVWWVNQRNYEFPSDWREVTLPKRLFAFAWGPGGGAPLGHIDSVEIVVTSFNGGKGTVWIDDLSFEALPAVKPYTGTPSVEVSSRGDGNEGPLAINSEGFLGWTSASDDPSPTATIDFGAAREFGGVELVWGENGAASDYRLEAEQDGGWAPLGVVEGGNGGDDFLVTPSAGARRVRVVCTRPGRVTLRSVRFLPPSFGDSPNELFKSLAAEAPRGRYPRYWLGEGTYWTVVGADADTEEALIGEDGAIELAKQGPSLEPFVLVGKRLITWNESANTQTLDEGYLPIPSVRREVSLRGRDAGLRLDITCFVDDAPPLGPGEGVLLIRYTLTNTGSTPTKGTLFLAARPMQVNPVYQFLNTPGGASRVESIVASESGLSIDGRLLVPLTRPAGLGATAIAQGEIVEYLASGELPARREVHDPQSLASATMAFPFGLEAGGTASVCVAWPMHAGHKVDPARIVGGPITADGGAAAFEKRLVVARARWRERLNRVEVRLPAAASRWWDAVRSNIAYILINSDGPGIQPGSRSYERTWIRDGSLTSSALLALGHEEEVRDFLDWFGPYQYADGKVPCCVDRRGPDPVPENDSHGEYIYAVMNYYRYTGDGAFLRRHWDRVLGAVGYIERLRSQRMTDEYRTGPDAQRVLYGLMPESISHEGYSAKPMHSYWDDFWTLKGLSDAAAMALALGEQEQASRLASLRDSFRATLYDSIRLAMKMKHVDYIPGCAELGDFDATSTTVGVWPCDELGNIPQPALNDTFERYWRFVTARRDAAGDQAGWVNYTPYEWRTVGVMVRMGWRERALDLSGFFFKDSRPAGWNHWAEVVWRDPRHAGFIGDMPHTWVGSDFINSFRSMLAFENDREGAMAIGAGLPLSWLLSDEGVRVNALRTHFGPLSFSTAHNSGTVTVSIAGGLRQPEGGLWFSPPNAGLIVAVRVNGRPATLRDGAIPIEGTPATVEIDYRR